MDDHQGENRSRLKADLLAGAASGVVATFAMSVLMQLGQRCGLLGEQPPRKVADLVLDRTDASEGAHRVGTAVVHLGIGALAGAAQQVARRQTSWPQPSLLWGGAAGGLLWTVNYFVLAPRSGILPPPPDDRPGRPPVMLASNVVWGATSALLGDRLVRDRL